MATKKVDQENTKAQEETKVQEETKTQVPTVEQEEITKVIYVGPTLPRGKLKCNTIYEGTEAEINKELENVLEEYPLVSKMLVPIEKLADAKYKVRTTGNIMNKYYTDLQSVISAKLKQEV